MKSEYGFVGYIKSVDTTHGKNGWHSHFHIAWAFENRLTGEQQKHIETLQRALWIDCVKAKGGFANRHGFDMIHGESDEVIEYILKHEKLPQKRHWDASAELTAKNKQSKTDEGRTPFQILSDYHDNPNESDARLWQEYAYAMHG